MATATEPKTEAATGPKGPDDVDVSDVAANRPISQDLANAIERASTLIEEKAKVLADLQAVRQYCDLSVRAGNGSREQVQWIRFYLPRKKRKTNGGSDDSED